MKLILMSLLDKVYDAEEFRNQGHKLVDILADYLASATSRTEDKTIAFVNPEKNYQYWNDNLLQGVNEDVSVLWRDIISQSTKLHHPRFMGHQVGVVAPVSAMTSMLTALLNNGSAVYEMGMSSNALERVISEILAKRLGYDSFSGGILTSGGSLANLTAMLAARAKYSNVWEDGTQQKLGIMVSEEAHYCIERAARIMGLGTEGLIKIPVDENYSMKTTLLDQYYQYATMNGIKIIAIVGSACSTSTGSYDNLEEIGRFAVEKNIWFHVDGAHGACVVFSSKMRHLVKGVEKADSVVIDWHKMMMTPALVTSLIFKQGSDIYKTFHQQAQYLFSSQSDEWYTSGKRTFECTKLMMSIKVYAILKTYGEQVLTEYVEKTYNNARLFANLINIRPNLELAMMPQSNIVCFRYNDPQSSAPDINLLIRQSLVDDGTFYIVQTMLGNRFFLRTTLMNPMTDERDMTHLLDEIFRLAKEIKGLS